MCKLWTPTHRSGGGDPRVVPSVGRHAGSKRRAGAAGERLGGHMEGQSQNIEWGGRDLPEDP